ncbi:MAG: hypothetical protein V4726_22125 [Verrucomicrobiota bacterium]
MNSLIITMPPRSVRPATRTRTPLTFDTVAVSGDGGDDLRQLARDIVRHDPILALLLARSSDRIRQQ